MHNRGIDIEREIREQDGTEYQFGSATSKPSLITIPVSVREKYLPIGEVQRGLEDFQDCATRAPINKLEMDFNYAYHHKLFKPDNLKWLALNGYVIGDKVEFSDRFIAIKSGTTRNGNSLKAPCQAIHEWGLIPKKILPKRDNMTWEDYHNQNDITKEMEELGREFKKRFKINYEQVPDYGFLEGLKTDTLVTALYAWDSSINGIYQATDKPFNHAVIKYKPNTFIYDNYEESRDDYIKQLASDYKYFQYDYRIFISLEKTQEDIDNELTIFQTLLEKGLIAFFLRFWEMMNETKPIAPVPEDDYVPELLKREKLYNEAKKWIGKDASPRNNAPQEFACAESVNYIYEQVFGNPICETNELSTYYLFGELKKKFEVVFNPLEGDIIISPTGYNSPDNPIRNGHVGIIGKGSVIMSNNSKTGLWDTHLSLRKWNDRYKIQGGYPVVFFRII